MITKIYQVLWQNRVYSFGDVNERNWSNISPLKSWPTKITPLLLDYGNKIVLFQHGQLLPVFDSSINLIAKMIPCQYVLRMCEGQTTVIMKYMVTTSFVYCIFNTSKPITTWNGG